MSETQTANTETLDACDALSQAAYALMRGISLEMAFGELSRQRRGGASWAAIMRRRHMTDDELRAALAGVDLTTVLLP